MVDMNPFEPPQSHEQQIRNPRRRRWPIPLALFLGAVLLVGGLGLLAVIRVGEITAMQAAANRQKQAADAQAELARDAASKAQSQQNP